MCSPPNVEGAGRAGQPRLSPAPASSCYPITVLPSDPAERQTYFRSLEAAQISATRDNTTFQRFIAEHVRAWLLRYLELVSSDVSLAAKNKGLAFFRAIAPYLNGQAKP